MISNFTMKIFRLVKNTLMKFEIKYSLSWGIFRNIYSFKKMHVSGFSAIHHKHTFFIIKGVFCWGLFFLSPSKCHWPANVFYAFPHPKSVVFRFLTDISTRSRGFYVEDRLTVYTPSPLFILTNINTRKWSWEFNCWRSHMETSSSVITVRRTLAGKSKHRLWYNAKMSFT